MRKLEKVKVDIDPRMRAERALSFAARQMVELAKAFYAEEHAARPPCHPAR